MFRARTAWNSRTPLSPCVRKPSNHLGKGFGAQREALGAGLREDGVAALGEGSQGRVFGSEALGGGAEEGNSSKKVTCDE